MNLETHINIIFNDIKINSQLSFIDLWKEVNKVTNHNFDLNTPLAFKRIVKNYYLYKYFKSISNLSGNILEVGVFKGFSGYLLKRFEDEFNLNNKQDHLFLVDSFEGLSKIKKEDFVLDQKTFQHQKGHFKVDYIEVENLFQKIENVNLIKGWIPNIFDCLDYIFDKIVPGGVIITDDFVSQYFPGNQIAWKEFFNNKKIISSIALPSGQAVYIKDI